MNDVTPTTGYSTRPQESPVVAMVRRLAWLAVIVFLPWMAYKGGVWTDVQDAVTRYRLSGTWHVDGSFADWKFGSDGTWMEDALIDTLGSYTLLEDNRIRIKGLLGATMEFKHSFVDGDLVLKGTNGTPASFRLTRKD